MLSVQRVRSLAVRSSSASVRGHRSSTGFRTLATQAAAAQQQHQLDTPQPVSSIWSRFAKSSKMPRVPLDLEFPGVPQAHNTEAKQLSFATQVSTLSNGLRVISLGSASPAAAVGVFVDTGSRDETSSSHGASQLLEILAFKSTKNQSDLVLTRNMLRLGANISTSSSRETLVYAADALIENIPGVVQNLADVVSNPLFIFDEVADAHGESQSHLEQKNQIPEFRITELLHEAAYKGTGLGRPLYGSPAEVSKLAGPELMAWYKQQFVPRRMVFAGVGVPHDQLVALAEANFKGLGDSSGSSRAASKYVGGDIRAHDAGSSQTHLAIGFESVSWNSKDLVPASVLQSLLGGGASFSSGGPGKGIYSRIYRSVLANNDWIDQATTCNNFYSDSGIFALYASSSAGKAEQLTKVVVDELKKLASPVDATELSRAKNQLKSSVLSQLESRLYRLEGIGRQLLASGNVQSPEEIVSAIDKVSADDVARVAKKILSSAPTVAAFGNLTNLPRYDVIEKSLKQ